MMTSALQRQKKRAYNSRSYGRPTIAAIRSSDCKPAIRSIGPSFKSGRADSLYHLIAIPCALIIGCAVWLGNRIMPSAK